jgi:hypothetical protein
MVAIYLLELYLMLATWHDLLEMEEAIPGLSIK